MILNLQLFWLGLEMSQTFYTELIGQPQLKVQLVLFHSYLKMMVSYFGVDSLCLISQYV